MAPLLCHEERPPTTTRSPGDRIVTAVIPVVLAGLAARPALRWPASTERPRAVWSRRAGRGAGPVRTKTNSAGRRFQGLCRRHRGQPNAQLIGGHRPSEQVALSEIASNGTERHEGFAVL